MATMETTGRPMSGAVPVAADTAGAGTAAVTIADPAPLGLAAFALTTMVLSAINVGWVIAERSEGADRPNLSIAFS